MDKVYCQCMTLIILLLLLNVALVIGVFLKWQVAQKKCKSPHWSRRSAITNDTSKLARSDSVNTTQDYSFVVGIVVNEDYDFSKELHCGGVIVASSWVVTAAHCINLLDDFPLDKIIVTGAGKLWKTELNHEVVFMISHNNYSNLSYNADIALVKVKEPFDTSFEPVSIANLSYNYEANKSVDAAGWISSSFGEVYRAHYSLHSVQEKLFDQKYCKELYEDVNEEITETMFCAGSYKGEKPACHFDSGGPLLDEELLIGVLSWGKGCGRIDEPSVYTKISLFEQWIYDTVNDNKNA